MARRLAVISGTLVLTVAVAATALAQSKGSKLGYQLGPVAGANLFTFGGSDATGAKTRTAFYVGAALRAPLGGGGVFLEPQVLYSQEGAKYTDPTIGTLTLKSAYLEVPILLGIDFGHGSSVTPHLFAGPAIGVNMSCDLEVTNGSITTSGACKDNGLTLKTLDLGVTGGGGITMPIGRSTFLIDARYTLGLTDITSGSNLKNQGFSVGAGLTIPVGSH